MKVHCMKSMTLVFFLTCGVFLSEAKAAANVDSNGVAIKGYDAVAYFTENQAVKGNSQHQHEWMGATWQFASKDNLDAFLENPEKFSPQYGGYCAYAVARAGVKADIDPQAFSIVNDKLYLNASTAVRAAWQRNTQAYIRVADVKWARIK